MIAFSFKFRIWKPMYSDRKLISDIPRTSVSQKLLGMINMLIILIMMLVSHTSVHMSNYILFLS